MTLAFAMQRLMLCSTSHPNTFTIRSSSNPLRLPRLFTATLPLPSKPILCISRFRFEMPFHVRVVRSKRDSDHIDRIDVGSEGAEEQFGCVIGAKRSESPARRLLQ